MDNSTDNELLGLLDEIRRIGPNRAYMFEEAFISSKLNRRIAISSRWQGYSHAGSAADTAIGSIYVSLPSGAAPYDTYDVCVGNHHYACSDADDIVDFIKSHVQQFDDMIIDDMKHSRRLYKSFSYTRQNGTFSDPINVYDNESTSDVYRKALSGSQGITSSDKMAISRKGNARIARRLVRIAKMLVAGQHGRYSSCDVLINVTTCPSGGGYHDEEHHFNIKFLCHDNGKPGLDDECQRILDEMLRKMQGYDILGTRIGTEVDDGDDCRMIKIAACLDNLTGQEIKDQIEKIQDMANDAIGENWNMVRFGRM